MFYLGVDLGQRRDHTAIAVLERWDTAVADRIRQLAMDEQLAGQVAASGESQAGAVWNVPKRDLIAGVQVLLERSELRISKGLKDARALVKELLDVRMTSSTAGWVRSGADGFTRAEFISKS